MRTQRQCLVKVAELRKLAEACKVPAAKAEYLVMSRSWEEVAVQAAWQEHWTTTQ